MFAAFFGPRLSDPNVNLETGIGAPSAMKLPVAIGAQVGTLMRAPPAIVYSAPRPRS